MLFKARGRLRGGAELTWNYDGGRKTGGGGGQAGGGLGGGKTAAWGTLALAQSARQSLPARACRSSPRFAPKGTSRDFAVWRDEVAAGEDSA